MLCGRPVFQGKSIIEIITQHMTIAPKQPSQINPEVPADLERVIMSCLDKDQDKRPPSAKALSEQLSACAAAADWSQVEASRWWSEHGDRVKKRFVEEHSAPTKTLTVAIPSGSTTRNDPEPRVG
jgi:serine/threonine protein kinase